MFLSVATIIGDYGFVGNFGTRFAALNLGIFGYVAYVYLPFLLYPTYCFYKSPKLTFKRLEILVSSSLFFVALLLLQSLTLSLGSFGNALESFLKSYIGVFGVWVLDIFFFLFAWLISTQRNIETLLKQLKNRLLVVVDFIRYTLIKSYHFAQSLLATLKNSLQPLIQKIFMPQSQDILDLQRSVHEHTQQAHYDFKDVVVEESFDEFVKPTSHTKDIANTHATATPIPESQPPINHKVIDSQIPQNAPTQEQETPQSESKPLIEVVKATKQVSLEEFFKNQIEQHQDMLKGLKQTPLFDSALTSQKPILQQNISTTSLHTHPHNVSQDNISNPHLQDETQTSRIREIPTPPPRPIDPNVFLPTPKTKDSLSHTQEILQNAPIEVLETSSTASATAQDDLNIHAKQQNILHENLKAAHTNKQDQKDLSLLSQPHILTPSREYDDNLQTQNVQFEPIHPLTHAQGNHAQLDTSSLLEQSSISSQDNHSLDTHSLEEKSLFNATPQQSHHQDSKQQESSFAVQSSLQNSTEDITHHQQTSTNIKNTKTDATQEYNTSWADSLIQEIPQAQKTYPLKNTQHTRITELAENKALLNNLEYGKVNAPLHFKLPNPSLLNQPQEQKGEVDESEIDRKIEDLLAKLKMFRVEGDIARTYSGPIVTTFEFRPAPNVKVSKILTLEDDLAMALRARSIRIQAPIPGKDVVGIEIPNNNLQTIYLREILESDLFKTSTSPLTLALGKDIVGNPFITDLKRLPHLLIAGTTGSGKSVGINAMILSLLYKNPPTQLKLLMIDPKKVEFSVYADIPHLITPIITQPKKAIVGLNSAMAEMDRRYDLMSEMRAKDIDSYNRKVQSEGGEFFPYLVIIIDELADLMMTGGKEVEYALARIAQMGRASGIHIIVATQRPSVDVVTGLIKTNLPSRISYKVGTKIDSKVILDALGAESLLGNGDMLFTPPGLGGVTRLHAPWNTEEEIERVVEFIKSQQEVEYDKNFMLDERDSLVGEGIESMGENGDLITEAKNIILQDKKTSASYLQRRLSIGYNKAANLIEQLEREGFLSAPNVKGIREILGS